MADHKTPSKDKPDAARTDAPPPVGTRGTDSAPPDLKHPERNQHPERDPNKEGAEDR
jgi:hypothetical protein